MDQNEKDEELQWRIEVLRTKLAEGKIVVADEMAEDLKQSLLAVRTGADGKIDLATVDGRLRSMALITAAMENRERSKDALSLEHITKSYFEFIEINLGFLVKAAKDMGADAHEFGNMISRHPLNVDEYSPQIPKFLEALEEFWGAAAEPSHYHIQDLQSTKAIYGGDDTTAALAGMGQDVAHEVYAAALPCRR